LLTKRRREQFENARSACWNHHCQFVDLPFGQHIRGTPPSVMEKHCGLSAREERSGTCHKQNKCANRKQFHDFSKGKRCFGSGSSGKRVLYVYPLAYIKACPRGSFMSQYSRTRLSITSVDC